MSTLTKQDRNRVYEFIGRVIFDVIFNQKGCVQCTHTFHDLDEYNQFAYEEIVELVETYRIHEDDWETTGSTDCRDVCERIFPMLGKPDLIGVSEKLFDLYNEFRASYTE